MEVGIVRDNRRCTAVTIVDQRVTSSSDATCRVEGKWPSTTGYPIERSLDMRDEKAAVRSIPADVHVSKGVVALREPLASLMPGAWSVPITREAPLVFNVGASPGFLVFDLTAVAGERYDARIGLVGDTARYGYLEDPGWCAKFYEVHIDGERANVMHCSDTHGAVFAVERKQTGPVRISVQASTYDIALNVPIEIPPNEFYTVLRVRLRPSEAAK